PLHEVAAEPVAGAERALEVHPVARVERAEPGALQRGADGANPEPAPPLRGDGEAGAAHGDALPHDQAAIRRRDRDVASPLGRGDGADLADRGHDAGEHGSRSRTSRVSSPSPRRSTALHRSASSKPASSQPETAGTPASPSQSGL